MTKEQFKRVLETIVDSNTEDLPSIGEVSPQRLCKACLEIVREVDIMSVDPVLVEPFDERLWAKKEVR